MRYLKVEWPEIQEYMDRKDYPEDCYFDPVKNCWFIPESWALNPYVGLTDEELKEYYEEMEADTNLAIFKDCGIW